jgi:hypothetical protein
VLACIGTRDDRRAERYGGVMGSLVVRVLSVVSGALVLLAMFGSGAASARDGLTGKTYDEASSYISEHNGTPVVGTVAGDQLEIGDCIVVSWHVSNFLNSSGKNDRKHDFVFNLNCNNLVAAPGKPGNSVMSPQGVAAKKDQVAAGNISKHPEWCQTTDQRMQYCQKICKSTELCSI